MSQKYRPKNFSEVVGQEAVVQTLKNAMKKGRLAHAYLFSGSHGTGKTTLARLFAKALNCKELSPHGEPCNRCTHCYEIDHAHSIDVLEIDGASHRGIEDVRTINETCAFIPTSCNYKIYIIDEVHMLTKEAFNALLKTLEEPPKNVKFFFATTEAHKLPKTILSRCQHFHLKRISPEGIVAKLGQLAEKQGIHVEKSILALLARFAKGGMRDAESLFDQLVVFEGGTVTKEGLTALLGLTSKEYFFKLDHAELEKDLPLVFEIAAHVLDEGKSCPYFLSELIDHFRTLLLIKTGASPSFYDEDEKKAYQESSALYEIQSLLTILSLAHEAEAKLLLTPSEQVWLEQLLLKIMQAKRTLSLESLVDKLLSLEKRITSSSVLPATPKPSPPAPIEKKEEKKVTSLKEQSRYDTIMRFASKELGGSLKNQEG